MIAYALKSRLSGSGVVETLEIAIILKQKEGVTLKSNYAWGHNTKLMYTF